MDISLEIKALRSILNVTQDELSNLLDVSFETINRWEMERFSIDDNNLEKVYSFAFSQGIKFNKIYEQLYREEYNSPNNKFNVLFHGSKNSLSLPIDLNHSRKNNDLGSGFYCGETFKQAAMYICTNSSTQVYSFLLNKDTLKIKEFKVEKDWMLAISYYRGWLNAYPFNDYLKGIIDEVEKADLVIAPIADNRMFDIISEFVRGEITDALCQHALSATNLGYQYVLRSDKALSQLSLLRCHYVCSLEKKECYNERLSLNKEGADKVKVARIEYRGKGQYIDELLL